MVKKISLSLEALIVVAVIFLLSFGFNLYQRFQYRDLIELYLETEWRVNSMETNWRNEQRLVQECNRLKSSAGEKPH